MTQQIELDKRYVENVLQKFVLKKQKDLTNVKNIFLYFKDPDAYEGKAPNENEDPFETDKSSFKAEMKLAAEVILEANKNYEETFVGTIYLIFLRIFFSSTFSKRKILIKKINSCLSALTIIKEINTLNVANVLNVLADINSIFPKKTKSQEFTMNIFAEKYEVSITNLQDLKIIKLKPVLLSKTDLASKTDSVSTIDPDIRDFHFYHAENIGH